MSINQTLSLGLLILSTAPIWGQDCASQQSAVSSIQLKVQADEEAIRRLNPSIQVNELEGWAQATEHEKQEILKNSLQDIAGTLLGDAFGRGVDATRGYTLMPMDIAGYHLPNGIGSLGTGQANAIIRSLEERGITTETASGSLLITAIRQASRSPNKRVAIDILSRGTKAALDTGIWQAQQGSDSTESLDLVALSGSAVAFQIAADLAGKGDLAVALGTALFKGGQNQIDAFVISHATKLLGTSVEQQLKAINALNVPLKMHVAQLQQAKVSLSNCQSHNSNQTQSDQKASGADYASERQVFVDRMKRDSNAMTRCVNTGNSCCSGCPPAAPLYACWTPCTEAESQCMAPLERDFNEAQKALDDFEKKNNYGYPKPK